VREWGPPAAKAAGIEKGNIMADIFISFIHEESETAEALQRFVNQMLSGQAKAFLSSDKFQIYAGELWLERIFKELSAAKVVLLLLSERSVTRPWVNFEAGAGWLTDKKIIPVCIKDLTKENLPKPYSSLQSIDLKYTDEQLYLIRSIAHHLGVEEPEILNQFGGALAILGGPEATKKVEAQQGYVDQFGKELRSAARIEKFLETHRDDLERGGMTTLSSLLSGSDKLPKDK
jgi:hypothetical protein